MHSKLYQKLMNSKAWRELRPNWLGQHPECEMCKRKGIVRAARCIHHIVPVESGRSDEECTSLCFSTSNLMSLCYECHAEIHKAERSHSKEMHKRRAADRLAQWIERHSKKTSPL